MILLKLLLAVLAITLALLSISHPLDLFRRKALRRILKDTAEILNAHGVAYWCDYGTLLGLVRDADLILGDKDVDVCVLETERPQIMAAAADFAARGYSLTGNGGGARTLMRVFDRRTPFYADIYSYFRDGDTFRSMMSSPTEDVPTRLVAERRAVQFLGVSLWIPKAPEVLLAYRYGPSYLTPRRNDKGRAGAGGIGASLMEDLEASALFTWFLMRRVAHAPREHV